MASVFRQTRTGPEVSQITPARSVPGKERSGGRLVA